MANKKYNSYRGKLKAQINKLRAYDKQLASYKKKNKITDAEYDTLLANSKELQKLAADEIQRVKSLAKEASTPKTEDEGISTDPADTTQPADPADETQPTDSVDTTQPADPAL